MSQAFFTSDQKEKKKKGGGASGVGFVKCAQGIWGAFLRSVKHTSDNIAFVQASVFWRIVKKVLLIQAKYAVNEVKIQHVLTYTLYCEWHSTKP